MAAQEENGGHPARLVGCVIRTSPVTPWDVWRFPVSAVNAAMCRRASVGYRLLEKSRKKCR